MELWKELFILDEQFIHFSDHFYLVSCEEGVEAMEYVALFEEIEDVANILEKEHVLLAARIEVSGRPGVLLCDPGYHIGRVITIMLDQNYPHTGK